MLRTITLGLRGLSRRPAYAALAVLTLSLGLGASVTAFSVVDAVLLRSLPYPASDRLVWIGESSSDKGETGTSFPALVRWRETSRTVASFGAFTPRLDRLTGLGNPEEVEVVRVSKDFFRTLGISPAMGRGFTAAEDRRGAVPVVVISHRFWRTLLAGRPDVLGTPVILNGTPHEVVGVMPSGFAFPDEGTLAWTPVLQTLGEFENTDGVQVVSAIGRMRPGATVATVEAELRQISLRALADGGSDQGYRPIGRGLREHLTRDVRPRVRVLVGAAVLILLLTCANMTNMFVTQVMRRHHELAVRRVLGASDLSIAGYLLTESALLSLFGIAGGLALAGLTLRFAARYTSTELPELISASVGARGAVVASVVALLTALVLSLATFAQIPRLALGEALKGGGSAHSGGRRSSRARDAFVVVEVAITLVLLVSAGVLAKSFFALANTRLGFDPADVYVAEISRPLTVMTPTDRPRIQAFMQAMLANLHATPGILATAVSSDRPASGNRFTSDVPLGGGADKVQVGVLSVSPGYFEALRIPLRVGRLLTAADDAPIAPLEIPNARPGDTIAVHEERAMEPAAVIDETLARRAFGSANPLGRTLELRDLGNVVRVVGVVAPVRQRGATAEPRPQVYLPYAEIPLPWATVVIRSRAAPATVLQSLRQAVAPLDAEQPITRFRPLAAALADSIDRSAFYSILLGAFAVASVLLTGVGLYGVVALLVAQRTREMGIRLSLGATPRQIFLLVMRRSVLLTLAGLVLGLALTGAATRMLSTLLFGISPTDAWVLCAGALLIFTVSVFASYWPARRASSVDPLLSLRADV